MTSYERSGASFGFGPGNVSKRVLASFLARTSNLALEMLENGSLGIYWREFLAWAWSLLACISSLGLEMLQNGCLKGFWREFLVGAWKFFKMDAREPSGANIWPGLGNTAKLFP